MIDKDKFEKWIDEMPNIISTNYDPFINSKVKYWLRGITDWLIDPTPPPLPQTYVEWTACSTCWNWKADLHHDVICMVCGRVLKAIESLELV